VLELLFSLGFGVDQLDLGPRLRAASSSSSIPINKVSSFRPYSISQGLGWWQRLIFLD